MKMKLQRICCTPSPVSTQISNLPEDVLADILSRLLLKQMVQGKSVSKLWRSLIDELCIPRVTSCSMHSLIYCTHYNMQQSGFLKSQRIPSSPYQHVIPNRDLCRFVKGLRFLDCCNGLFLVFDLSAMNYCVLNPSTSEVITIPNIPAHNEPPDTTSLIFHPPHYKLISVSLSGPTTYMNIFSPETGSWCVHELGDLGITYYTPRRQIFHGNSLYKLSGTGHVFKFDVIEEIGYKTIQLPEAAKTTNVNIGCIGTSQGSLHFGWDDKRSKMMVWTLEAPETDAHWVLKHTISLAHFAKHSHCIKPCDTCSFSVIAFHPTSDDIFVANSGIIFCYNLDTKRLEVIVKDESIYTGQDHAHPFSINLTPLDAFVTPPSL